MLVSVAKPILQVTSNSLFAFVFCNLIVLAILIGTKFSSTDHGSIDAMPVSGVHRDVRQAEIDVVERFSYYQIVPSSCPETQGEEKLALTKVTEVCEGEIKQEEENRDIIIECKDDNDNENQEEEGEEVNDDEDDNGDDELRKRIEDFIAKVNREWEAENLKEIMHQLTQLDSADAPN